MKIMSWNVASIRARMEALTKVLSTWNPDIVMLQEIKATNEQFPFLDLKSLGFHAYISGQKAYNGVALLSKEPLSNVITALPGFVQDADVQARFIEGQTESGAHVICVYVPNGNPPMKDPADTSRLAYKLKWMAALTVHIQGLLKAGVPVILGGDFNVIERDGDVYNPDLYRDNALMVPSVRAKFADLNALALHNTIRALHPENGLYSFWDFQMGAWRRNHGMLLDHLFVSDDLKAHVADAGILKEVRGWEKTSDHVPIWCELK